MNQRRRSARSAALKWMGLWRRPLRVEQLEARRMLATVNTLLDVVDSDDGETSLREAIAEAVDGEVIDFSVTGTIALDNDLGRLEVDRSLTIDGENQITIDGGLGGDGLMNGNGIGLFVLGGEENDPVVILNGLTLTGADGQSAISSISGSLLVSSSTIHGNSGRGIYARSQVVVLSSTISANNGGGISSRRSNLTIESSTISGNTSNYNGGGIDSQSGNLTIRSSTISGNTSPYGGGIFSESALSITSSTISANDSLIGDGGGIYNRGWPVHIESSTITNNRSVRGFGGGISVVGGNLEVSNSILAGNDAPGTPDAFADSRAEVSVNFSFVGNGTGLPLEPSRIDSPDQNGNIIGSSDRPFNPQLAPLANNGGTVETHALLPGSPALDAGWATSALDQRGQPRQVSLPAIGNMGQGDGSDMGSFELQSIDGNFLPTDVVVSQSTGFRYVDLSGTLFLDEDGGEITVTISVNEGSFLPSPGGVNVARQQIDSQTIAIIGNALDVNSYFDILTRISYLPASEAVGNNSATLTLMVDNGDTSIEIGAINLDIPERGSRLVTTEVDIVDPYDGITSLREAIAHANVVPGHDRIEFDPNLASRSFLLDHGELVILDGTTIGSLVPGESLTIDAQQRSRVIKADDAFAHAFDIELNGVTITGGNTDRTFQDGGGILFESDGRLTLQNSRIVNNRTNGTASAGGGISSTGSVAIFNSEIEQNSSASHGGGIASTGNTAVQDSVIHGNMALGRGGGIDVTKADLVLRNSTVSGNQSRRHGGGIWNSRAGVGYPFSLVLHESTISQNSSDENGGGIGGEYVSMYQSTVHGNNSLDGGGGIVAGMLLSIESVVSDNMSQGGDGGISVGRFAELIDSKVNGNSVANVGGSSVAGISTSNRTGTVRLTRSTVSNNSGGSVGGIRGGSVFLTDSTVSGNVASGLTGAIYSYGQVHLASTSVEDNHSSFWTIFADGGISLEDSTVTENTTSYDRFRGTTLASRSGDINLINSSVMANQGGGIDGDASISLVDSTVSGNTGEKIIYSEEGPVSVLRSTVSNNTSTRYGGGIRSDSGAVSIIDSTVSRNMSRRGGGIYVFFATVEIRNSTVTENVAEMGGGLYAGRSVEIENSIISGNSANESNDLWLIYGQPIRLRYNLIGQEELGDFGIGNLYGIDAGLLPLADNGGPTLTHALAFGSPAINAGDPAPDMVAEFDQRGAGFSRIVGGRIDIGAVEFQTPITSVDGDINDDGNFDCADINLLTNAVAAGITNFQFDINGDDLVNVADIDAWLIEAGEANYGAGAQILPGDANLDGVVDISDFNIWNEHKFTANSEWCSGNFSGDDVVDVSDFNDWSENKFTSGVPVPLQRVQQNDLNGELPSLRPNTDSTPAFGISTPPGLQMPPYSSQPEDDRPHDESRVMMLDVVFGEVKDFLAVKSDSTDR